MSYGNVVCCPTYVYVRQVWERNTNFFFLERKVSKGALYTWLRGKSVQVSVD